MNVIHLTKSIEGEKILLYNIDKIQKKNSPSGNQLRVQVDSFQTKLWRSCFVAMKHSEKSKISNNFTRSFHILKTFYSLKQLTNVDVTESILYNTVKWCSPLVQCDGNTNF